MEKLLFKEDKNALDNLAKAAQDVEDFLDSHSDELNEEEHAELRELLNNRASALSEATGLEIHSICE